MELSFNELCSLVPTHNRLRNPHMIQVFRDEILSQKSGKPKSIVFKHKITIFECNGVKFLHDGHHRICAYYSIGFYSKNYRDFLIEEDKIYHQVVDIDFFTKPNIAAGWVTPYNPFAQVRTPDFFHLKPKLFENYSTIERLLPLYTEPREVKTIDELYSVCDFSPVCSY